MLEAQDTISVVPNQSDYKVETPKVSGVPDVIGMFGGSPSILPAQTNYDEQAAADEWVSKPSSAQANIQPVTFDWKESGADMFVNADRYRQEGFDPYMGSTEVNGKTYDLNVERYDQLQSWGNAMKKGVGQFWGLTKNTFVSSLEGEGRMLNAMFNWGSDKSFKERLIGTPEELAIQDEEQKAIFNKYAIFHGSSADASTFNKQFVGDLIGQTGFAIGPLAEFLTMTALTAGVGEAFSMATKGMKLAGETKAITLAAQAEKAIPMAERINDLRKVNDITKNTRLMDDIMGSLSQAGRWGAKQLNPLTGVDDIMKASEAGVSATQLGITSVGALKRLMGQSNMAFNEARFEAAGTFGQLYGDLIAKYQERNGKLPEGEELEKIKATAYGAATDNFIVNSGILMTMNQIQFGSLFSKFSSTSKVLREAIESGAAQAFEVSGNIEGKAATRLYASGKLGSIGKFNTIRKDFGLGTALYTVSKKSLTGTAAKFELSEGVQELLQTGSDNTLRDYYTNLYDGGKDLEGVNLADANWTKGIQQQYNRDGWKTFLMGAMTGYLISPMQASTMYAVNKGYSRINDTYRKETADRKKTIDDAIDLQNSFYKDPKNALNPAIGQFKIIGQANKNMEQALKSGDKYSYFNAKGDILTSTVSAALKTNTLPALLDQIREIGTTWTDQQIAEAFPAAVSPDGNMSGVKGYIASIAQDIEQYHKNWEALKEEYGHLVMPELYKANKEEYTKALWAKRALDEAIELLATTDYKATDAIKRATEIKSKFASIPGIGSSIGYAFNILSSEEQTEREIQNLLMQVAAGTGLSLDKSARDLLEQQKEQLKHLIEWQAQYQEEVTDENIDSRYEKMSKAFESYIGAHNAMGASTTQTTDRGLLKKALKDLKQYMALTKDADDYIQALNVLSDPRNFKGTFDKIRKALEEARDINEKKANKEAEDTINETLGEEDEDTEPEETDEDIDIKVFAGRMARGADMSSPEDVQFYENNKEAVDAEVQNIKEGGVGNRITRIANMLLNNEGIVGDDDTFLQANKAAIIAEYNRLKAEKDKEEETEDDTDSDTNNENEIDEEEKTTPEPLQNPKFKITNVNDLNKVVSVDRAATDAILSTIPADMFREGATLTVKKNSTAVTITDAGNGRFKVVDSRRDDGVKVYPSAEDKFYTRQEADAKVADMVTARPMKNSKTGDINPYVTVSPQQYSMKVEYMGQVIGYMVDPDIYTFNFGKGNIPVDQLTLEQFSAVFEIPVGQTAEETYKKFLDSYHNGQEVKRQIENLMGTANEVVLSGPQTPLRFIVSPGEYDTISENQAEERTTLAELIAEGNRELVGVIDVAQERQILLEGDNSIVEQLPEQSREILGNYIAKVVLPNGRETWIQLKSPVIQDEQLQGLIDSTNKKKEELVNRLVDGDTISANDTSATNDLQELFITTQPNGSTYFYINITQKGDYNIVAVSGVGKGKVRKAHKITGNLPTDPEKFRKKLTTEIRKIGPKVRVTDAQMMEQMGIEKGPRTFDWKTVEVTRNNIRQSLPKDATTEQILSMVPTVSQNIVKNIGLTYISGEPTVAETKSVAIAAPVVVPTVAPIEGGGNVNIQMDSTQPIVVPAPEVVAETPKTTTDEVADSIAAKGNRLSSRKRGPKSAKKVLTEQQAGQYVENMQKFKDWIATHLPDTISVDEVDTIVQDLTTNNITAGEFLIALLDTGKIGGKVRVTPGSTFKYHEAFHAIFRLLLPQQRIDYLLAQVAKESLATAQKLQDMRKLHTDYREMDDAELTERYYEEYLADKFDTWKNNRAVNTHHGIKGFFARLWDIIQKIAAILTRNDIKRLFYQVEEGQFRNTQVQVNQFTEDTAFIDSMTSVKKAILVDVKEIDNPNDPDNPIVVDKYLPQQEGDILSSTIAALFFRDIETKGQFNTRQTLDSIIDRYAELYNPTQQKYITMLDSITDPYLKKQQLEKLTDYYTLFTNPIAKQSLREAVQVYLKINGIKQDLEDDQYESMQEEHGERNTENFDRNAGSIGGYKSLAKGLRQYISGTVLPYKDVFGNTQFNDGTPLQQAANANYIYNGLLKTLSNSSDVNVLMQKLNTYYLGEGNTQTTAFIQRLMDDTGLVIEEDGTFTVGREENSILAQQVLKGFNQYEVDHLHTLIDKDNNYITTLANKQKAADSQLNMWAQSYENQFYNGLGILTAAQQKSKALSAVRPLDEIGSHIGNSEKSAKKIPDAGKKGLPEISRLISNELKASLGINLHPTYIAYSIAANKDPEARTKKQAVMVESFKDSLYITPEALSAIRSAVLSGQNIFSKVVGIAGRAKDDKGEDKSRELRLLAEGNSAFDETVNTMSYVTADGETVYAHKLPTFYNRSIYNLNKQSVLDRYRQDESKQSSYLLDSKEFQFLSEEGKVRALSTDGMRRENENKDSGIVYGDYNKREKLAYLLGMYNAARKIVTGKNTGFYVVPHEIRVVEAKNSAPYVYLPVIKAVVGSNLSKDALNKMTAVVQSEVARIAQVKEELKQIEAGTLDAIEGYHTGAQRGLRLFETANMVGDMRAEIEAGAVDIPRLHEQLNKYWKEQTAVTIDMMVQTGLIYHDKGNNTYTNVLAPSYLFNGIADMDRNDSLNLVKDNLQHNVMQVVVDDYINTDAINTLLLGNEAKAFKDSTDRNKRAAGANAEIVSMTVDVLCPKWGIDAPLSHVHHVTYRSHEFNKLNGGRGDQDDAQMYITEKALRYMLFGFGKLNQTQVDILNKLSTGEHVTQQEFFGAGGLKEKGAFNSYKLVHFDGEVYLKCSALPLFREWVSIPDGQGGWAANPETEELHTLLNKMEEQERRLEEQGKNIVVFAHPVTASKALKRGVVEDINDITDTSFEELSAEYTGLQLENPSNKVQITDPTQAKEQIMAEQDDDTDVIFMGVPTKAGIVKQQYMQDTARRKANNYNAAANDIFTLEDGIIELGKAIDLNKVTPKLGNFYKRAVETMIATGTDSHTLGFFELDEDGQPIYNNNFPSILPKFTELFLSYFSKGILSEKVPGTSVALVSNYGMKKFKKVLSLWQTGDLGYLPELEGQPRTWTVITSAEVQQNPEYYRNIAKRWVGDNKEQLMERKFFNLEVGDIILDDLRHNYPKYSADGIYLGKFSEFVMPAHYKEVMDRIPESLRYNFGIRIPSDDKHSYISLEYVDTLPVQYGSIGIFPQELIEISGADFDIDKLYMQFMDTYVEMQREDQNEYDSLKEMVANIKTRLNELSEAFENTPGYSAEIANEGRKIKELKKYAKIQYDNLTITQDEYLDRVAELDNELESLGTMEGAKYRKPIIKAMKQLSAELVGIKARLKQLTESAVRIAYGTKTDTQGAYDEYLNWQFANNKVLKSKVAELEGIGPNEIGGEIVGNVDSDIIADIEDIYELFSATPPDALVTKTALAELGMPMDAIEYYDLTHENGVQVKELNNGVLNNRTLSAKIALLNNEHISADTVEKRAIINQPTSVDMLAGLVSKFKNMFEGMMNDPNTTEEDKKGLDSILAVLTDPITDVNSIPGKVLAYSNNKEGSRNIGAAVNSMLTFSIMNQFKVPLSLDITYGGDKYNTFEEDTTSDGVRKFAQISSIVNAMTDNAKERLASKLGLNIEAVGYVSAMVAIGIPMESAVLLIMQPVVRDYFARITNLKGQLKTGEESKTSRMGVLPKMLKDYQIALAKEQKVELDKVKGESLSDQKLIKNIANGGQGIALQYSILKMLSTIDELSGRMTTVANVTKLSKGLPTSFADVDKIAKNLMDLVPNPLMPAIFEPYDVLTRDNDITATDIAIMQQTLVLATKVFTERTPSFIELASDVEGMMNVPEGAGGDPYRKQLRDDLVSYLDITAYIQYLKENENGRGLNTLNHSLIYSNDDNNIIGRVKDTRDAVRGSIQGENYLLNRYLSLVPTDGTLGKVNEIHTNSWTTVSEQVQEKMASAFVDLYTNAHTTPDGTEINTHDTAVAMFNYLLVKDGGQFKSNSFIKYIPNFIFQDILNSAGIVNKVLSREYSEQEIIDTFGMNINELKAKFIQSYGEHINNKRYIKEVPVTVGRESGQPAFYTGWNRPNNEIMQFTLPQSVVDDKLTRYAGLTIEYDDNGAHVQFPLYMKLPQTVGSGLFKLEWTDRNKELTTATGTSEGSAAQYKKIDWKGSPNTWKGAGVYGPLPVTPGANNQVVGNNPSYNIATPENNQTDAGDGQDIQQQEAAMVYTTPAQAIEKVGLKVYIQGNSFMVLESNVDAVPIPLEQYANQGFRTPTELGEWIMDRAGWYEEPIEKDENEQVVSEQPVVSSQTMEPVVQQTTNIETIDKREEILTKANNRVRKAFEDLQKILNIGEDVESEDKFHFLDSSNSKDKYVVIDSVYLPEKHRKKGLGLSLYIIRGEELLQTGKVLINQDGMSSSAWKIWHRLSDLGLATMAGKAATFEYIGLSGLRETLLKDRLLEEKKLENKIKKTSTVEDWLNNTMPEIWSGAIWKEQLSAIYKEKGITRPEREWTQDRLQYRNTRRTAGIPDTTIIEEIKNCK